MKKALVLSLAVVFGLGVASFAQTLSGSWDTTIGIVATNPVVLTLHSELDVTYSVSGWSFTSQTVFDADGVAPDGWVEQNFLVDGALGAFTIGSELVFNPLAPAFTSWEVSGGLNLAGVNFDATFTLIPGDVTLEIVGSGSAGDVDVTVDITFGVEGGGCDLDFAGVDIEVDFPFCCADVVATLSFDCAGFVNATFGVAGIELPGLSWVTLDALLTFDIANGKTLKITPNFDFGAEGCFDIYIAASGDSQTYPGGNPLEFGTLTISGIGLTCEIGGVEFTGLSYWGATGKPSWLGDYWEAYKIATTDDACCGPFGFDITVYFDELGVLLFDIAELDANMSLQIATQLTFTMGIDIVLEPAPGTFTLDFGFEVTW